MVSVEHRVGCEQCKVNRSNDNIQCAMYSVWFAVTLRNMQCAVFSVQCAVYSVQCRVYILQCTVNSVQCIYYSVQCAMYSSLCEW